MKKSILGILILLCVAFNTVSAQQFFTKTGKVYFSASSSLEKIEATTNKATCVVDIAAGKIEAAILVKSFHFEKALMEEHFNENYMESGKFTQAKFVGDITDAKNVNLKSDGTYDVNIKGKLTLHGVTKDVATKGKITVKGGNIIAAASNLTILVGDYGIKIPGAVKDKIAKEAKIDINCTLQPLK
jgi:polyisoprenoid-binding protein YceI